MTGKGLIPSVKHEACAGECQVKLVVINCFIKCLCAERLGHMCMLGLSVSCRTHNNGKYVLIWAFVGIKAGSYAGLCHI